MSLRAVLAPYHDDESPPLGIFRCPPFDYSMDYAHLRLWEISVLLPSVIAAAQTYRSVIFVRDPYRRFVSALDQHFKTYCPDLPLLTTQPEQQVAIGEIFLERFLRVETVRTPFTSAATLGQRIVLPVAHGEGCYYADDQTLAELKRADRVVLRYIDNPNGSLDDIAGICSPGRNVMGMMPHPERAADALLGSTEGRVILESMVQSLVTAHA